MGPCAKWKGNQPVTLENVGSIPVGLAFPLCEALDTPLEANRKWLSGYCGR